MYNSTSSERAVKKHEHMSSTCGSACRAELACKFLSLRALTDEVSTDRSADWRIAFGGDGAFGGDRNKLLGCKCLSAVLMTSILIWSLADWVHFYGGDGHPRAATFSPDDDVVDDDVYQPAHSDSAAFGYWPIKVTHWTLSVQVFYLWLSTYTAHKATEEGAPADMPWFAKLSWYFHAVTLPATFFVFALYWGLVFNGTIYAVSICTHGLNFFVQLFDSFATRAPYRLVHGVYFLAYMLTYLTFTLLYYASGGRNEKGKNYVYGALDWSSPGSTVPLVLGIILVIVPIIHTCFWWCKFCSAAKNAASNPTPAAGAAAL